MLFVIKRTYGVVNLDGVEVIEDNAFAGCSNLKNINLGNSLKKIGSDIFGSEYIKTIEIPSSIEEIKSSAFIGCSGIERIYIHKKKDEIPGAPWGAVIGDRAIIWD